MTGGERATLTHLWSCFDTTYRVLGEVAPTLARDAYVVRVYEAARSLGEVALELRALAGTSTSEVIAPLEDVLRASAEDTSGAMVLFCLVSVVGPRVLVSLRDAREAGGWDGEALEVLGRASGTLIGEMHAVGAIVCEESLIEDENWQERARGLSRTLDDAGFAESFGTTG